ncbi:hypothetical protein [Rhodococcus sp. A14]|uniref:hypothetical protein n=1 Tax=Rhodococcus sp. A14 TaxID=1194106 RepID=UPI0014234947|nr:hypothetical protein [Rhodococcus sp. A14]
MSTGEARERISTSRIVKSSSELAFKPSRESLDLASEIARSSKLRVDIPIRHVFVRDLEGEGNTPLSRLVATRGRGNAVAIKLYLALIWRCAAPPFDTQVSSRKWAALLSLDDPERGGAKRVSDAFRTLAREKLISVTANPGGSSTIQLLEESGTGAAYDLPSTAYVLANDQKERHRYFKVPTRLWTQGHIQSLSAPALAVMLAVLSSQEAPGKPVWWSTILFPARFGLSPATRARGTKELVDRGLLKVGKTLVNESHFSSREFTQERVRNVYRLTGAAGPVRTVKKKPRRRRPGPTPPPPLQG